MTMKLGAMGKLGSHFIVIRRFNLQLVPLAMVAKALKRGAYHVYYCYLNFDLRFCSDRKWDPFISNSRAGPKTTRTEGRGAFEAYL